MEEADILTLLALRWRSHKGTTGAAKSSYKARVVTKEAVKMDEKYKSTGNYSDAGACETKQKSETLPGILAEIEKLANQLREMTEQASDNINGSSPKNPEKSISGRTSSIIGAACDIRITLREAANNQQRVLNALAL